MTTSGLGPHIPKPGYRKRWSKQAAALVFRSPDALLMLAAMGAVVIILPIILIMAATFLTGAETLLAQKTLRALTPPFAVIALLFTLGMIMRADLGIPVNVSHIRRVYRDVFLVTGFISVSISLLSMVIFGLPEAPSAHDRPSATLNDETASTGLMLAVVLKIYMTFVSQVLGNTLFLTGLAGSLFLASIVGANLGVREARTLDRLFLVKMKFIHFEIFMVTAIITLLAQMFGPFGLIAVFYAIAWTYVAAREIVGGISENGKPQTSTEKQGSLRPKLA